MSNFKETISTFWNKYKKDIIFIGIIILLIVLCIVSINSCNKAKQQLEISNHNIEVLCDSIDSYEAKNGQLVYENGILIGDNKTLELAYKELNEELKNMKVKNWEQALQIKGYIDNPLRDTSWIYVSAKTDSTIINSFNFNNKYRELEGWVAYNKDNMAMQITSDKVFFDYSLAINEGKVYVTSSNPYVITNQIEGITISEPKKKHWGFNINLGIGCQYGLINKKFDVGPQIGIGFGYIF